MSKAFPTRHEPAVSYGRWVSWLSITGFVPWLVCYVMGDPADLWIHLPADTYRSCMVRLQDVAQ